MRVEFPQYGKQQLVIWIERFFKLWCRNQWKRERYAPSFHVDDENLDPKTWCRFPILSGGYERELGALAMAGLCDAPREGAVVGNTQDQAPFAAQEARRFRHDLPRWPATASLPMTQGKRPHKQPPLVATSAPSAAGISLGAKCLSVWYR